MAYRAPSRDGDTRWGQYMSLLKLLSENNIKINMSSVDKEECFEELVDVLIRSGQLNDRQTALSALWEREAHSTTGIGKGYAVPHGKHIKIPKLCVTLGISARGIDYDAVDTLPVKVVFMVLANANEPGPHIQALAEIGRLFKTPNFLNQLCATTSPQAVLRLLEKELQQCDCSALEQ